MKSVARLVGVLVLGVGAAGVAMTMLSHGGEPLAPLWSDMPWTATARRAADWAAYAALAAGGLTLRIEPGRAVWPLSLAVALASAMVGYDVLVDDPDVTRQQAMLRGDIALAAATAVALFTIVLALDEHAEHSAPDA